MSLVKENIKVGSVICRLRDVLHCFDNELVLILKISDIDVQSMTYDALILPSKRVVYYNLVSMFKFWKQIV